MKLSEELVARGFVHQVAGESLAQIVDGPTRTIYYGIDPSSDSATVGNFAVWVLLKHLMNAGHTVVFLVGGGTGMIGDPKPDAERSLATREEIDGRVKKLKAQAENFFAQEVRFVDNYDWLGSLELITFLRDIGKHFTVNELMKKDAIATRLSGEVGLSYTEFAYPLLQAYDYLKLHEEYGCDVQVGGSDQWGNIVAGVDLVRRKTGTEVYAITMPLVIDAASGKKFGKSEGNAVWLDPEKTSPFAFYQFWLNVSDASVVAYLKYYTMLPLSEIEELRQVTETDPAARKAQKALAYAVTELVHTAAAAEAAQEASELLFGGSALADLSDAAKTLLRSEAPSVPVTDGMLVVDVLISASLAASKREARTFIAGDSVTLDGEKVTDGAAVLDTAQFTDGIAVLRRGKKQACVLVG